LRVLIIDKEFPPNKHGGIGVYNQNLAYALSRLGHSVIVLTLSEDRSKTITNQPYGILIRIPGSSSLPRLCKYLRWINPLILGQILYSIIIQIIVDYKIDLIEIPSAGGYGYSLPYKLNNQVPIITRFHGSLGNIPIENHAKAALSLEMQKLGKNKWVSNAARMINSPLWTLEIQQIKNSQVITFPSEFSLNWLETEVNLDQKEKEVIHNGVDIDFESRSIKFQPIVPVPDEKRIVFVGRCSIAKGVSVFARAVPKILNNILSARILFVGPLVDPLVKQELLRLSKLFPNRVILMGQIEHPKVLQILPKIDVLVLPTFYEISPMVVLEAMSNGKPVVASNVGPLPEIVKDQETGLLFTVGDEDDLAAKVIEILDSESRYKAMSEASFERIHNYFNMMNIMKELVMVYQHSIEGVIN